MLLAAACIGGDAQIQPCPAGVKDDLNWYTTTSSGKVHDCAWLRIEDPSARMLPTGYVFFLLGASLAMLVLCGIQCKSFCRTPVRYGGVGSDTIISVSDDPDDDGFEMSGSSSMV